MSGRVEGVVAPAGAARRALVVYDGECSFCRANARLLRGLDRAGRLRLRPLQDEGLYVDDPRLSRSACEQSVHLVAEDGTIYAGSAAFREAVAKVGFGPIAAVMRLPVVRDVAELVYRFVGRNHR